ncbi:hypothetical protein ACFL45_09570 [Candidatus Neomarinimicrobiota bacterium]
MNERFKSLQFGKEPDGRNFLAVKISSDKLLALVGKMECNPSVWLTFSTHYFRIKT